MLRLTSERASRARLVFLWLVLAVTGCGNGDVRGEWTGTHATLGPVTLMLDLDGHFELTLAHVPSARDSLQAMDTAAAPPMVTQPGVTYSGRYEVTGDTIHLRGIPAEYHAVRKEGQLVLAARGHTVRLRRQ